MQKYLKIFTFFNIYRAKGLFKRCKILIDGQCFTFTTVTMTAAHHTRDTDENKEEKNPAEEAIVLFSKSINNLHDDLHEDYFLSVFRENLPG